MKTIHKLPALLFLGYLLMACESKVQQEQPNVLLIITDDQGWGDLSFHGNQVVETPHIDALASQSIVFDRFYVSPVCAPTRASLLTGRYHIATGTTWVTHRMEVMREEEVTIAELLKPHGYISGLFGKWHQGKQFPHDPIGQGFDEFFGFTEGHLNNYFDTKLTHNFEEIQTEGFLPDVLTDKTIEFMEKQDSFFAMLSLNTPHSPFQVPDAYFDKYKSMGLDDKDACVYGMVENIDDNVGRLMEFLKESGKIENTIVIFMTDNGPNGIRYNGGMKGKKADLDEGGVRVPFFIKIPNFKHQIVKPWAGHIDILPTLAELLNIKIPEKLGVHGRSLFPLIKGEVEDWKDRDFFTHHVHLTFDTIPGAVRNQEYLLTIKNNQKELYNLLQDPSQKANIIDQQPGIAGELEMLYLDWLKEMTKKGVEPPLIQIGHPHVTTVELPASDGKRLGNVLFKGGMGWANDWFINFKNPEDKVFWEMESIADSNYEVFVQMANDSPFKMEVSAQGSKLFYETDQIHQTKLIPNQDRVPRTEVEEMEWPMISVGEFRFEAGAANLEIGFLGKDLGNIELKSVFLKKLE
ncbi:arylsulfatase A [Aquiflexum balticum DSM 16537]|uniref:Arylsulfatase A n=1 Tax=Aquiflexum balticum DSM 16537 TaxID=758820 RepID=A0A1W2H713_9BACT|nr:arylsulfatase [Aquiflexum balticum]SMD44412.1 arylsulfatase A [Aquiflexum balticum DSM 16537]